MTTLLLELKDCAVDYGQVRALAQINLEIGNGEVVALIGSNGAGKTTLMKSIVGLLRVTQGELLYAGHSIRRTPTHSRVRQGIGYAPEGRRIFPGLDVIENLEVASPDAAVETARRVDWVLSIFPGLREKTSSLGWTLSGGQQQMLAIGRALMVKPRLLLLDEPSLGLSPRLTDQVMSRIPQIRETGTSVLIAEQNMTKALEVSQRAYVLRNGRIVKHGPSSELRDDPHVRSTFLGGH